MLKVMLSNLKLLPRRILRKQHRQHHLATLDAFTSHYASTTPTVAAFHCRHHAVRRSKAAQYHSTIRKPYISANIQSGDMQRPTDISTRIFSVSAYSGIPSDGKAGIDMLSPLPLATSLPSKDGQKRLVEVGTFDSPQDIETGRRLMNDVIVEGKAWPFEPIFDDEESYRGYFMSHAAFLVRDVSTRQVLGCFYIKPNFPGRCNHICNGGFIVDSKLRGQKVGTLMGACFLKYAKQLGYKAAYFNLVFASNRTSIIVWEKLGFQRVATIPNAARLEGMPADEETGEPMLDTAYGYHYDLTQLSDDYDPLSML